MGHLWVCFHCFSLYYRSYFPTWTLSSIFYGMSDTVYKGWLPFLCYRVISIQSETELGWGWTAILVWVSSRMVDHSSWSWPSKAFVWKPNRPTVFPFVYVSLGPTPHTFRIWQCLQRKMAECCSSLSLKRFLSPKHHKTEISFYILGQPSISYIAS